MTPSPELTQVEQPFIDQLVSMGWKHVTGSLDHPDVTGRESFREVLLLSDLREALRRINRDPQGQPWLDEGRLTQAVSALQRLGATKLMEANQKTTELLIKGTVVDGVDGWDQGRGRRVHYIDWKTPKNNTFRVINQFRVDEPGGQSHQFIAPDLVLFINGLPLVVVECKRRDIPGPTAIPAAIGQLQRYANQRHWVDASEGNEKLFHTSQFVVATNYDAARVGTFSSESVHFLEWKDTSPVPTAEVVASFNQPDKKTLSSQETLVAGMLRPAHLLDIVRHFTLFMPLPGAGKLIKLVCRYQQFRAVQRAVQRLLAGKTRLQDGEYDRRGGIIWHTQGSGKSLTMVFLVRAMRSHPELRRFKVVVVTDRKDLQKQLADTAALTDEPVSVARRTAALTKLLAEPGAGLVFAMIQKLRDPDSASDDDVETDDDEDALSEVEASEDLGELNTSEDILVLVDEAHRSHGSALHGNLLKALPNCARIGFTGTPIIMGAKKRTHEIFGAFIDRYTIKQSEEDGATVPILYEGRTAEGAVKDKRDLDQLFDDMLADRTPAELEAIKKKYATKGHVMEAPALIAEKARDMLRHYVSCVMPNGFKAQVVAVSRHATIRYAKAFEEARDALVAELEVFDGKLTVDIEAVSLEGGTEFLAGARPYLDTIRRLEFAPIISGSHNDDGDWLQWTERGKLDARIARFKKPLPLPNDPHFDDPEKRDPLAFLIVKSMLLTGFDAPVEQVIYLDRHIKQAELLQAIARVNRTNGERKNAGFVVDYFGVARHLEEALAAYSTDDIQGALQSLKDELPKLRDQHRRTMDVFVTRGLEDLSDEERCVELLRDEKVRAEFTVKLKQFLTTLDLVLPRPEALPFVNDARKLGSIQTKASRRYRDEEPTIGEDVGAKVRRLIDEHVLSLGIDPKIPPVNITDADFDAQVDKCRSPRAKASEMEHALRYHLRQKKDEDPEFFEKLSDKLKSILTEMEDQWEKMVEALQKLVDEARTGRKGDETGLDPETQAPFFGLLKAEAEGELEEPRKGKFVRLTVELVEHVKQELGLVNFWANAHAQEVLRKWMVQFLDGGNGEGLDVVDYGKLEPMADRLMELAKANHYRLVR